jgi:hypothetical protein
MNYKKNYRKKKNNRKNNKKNNRKNNRKNKKFQGVKFLLGEEDSQVVTVVFEIQYKSINI